MRSSVDLPQPGRADEDDELARARCRGRRRGSPRASPKRLNTFCRTTLVIARSLSRRCSRGMPPPDASSHISGGRAPIGKRHRRAGLRRMKQRGDELERRAARRRASPATRAPRLERLVDSAANWPVEARRHAASSRASASSIRARRVVDAGHDLHGSSPGLVGRVVALERHVLEAEAQPADLVGCEPSVAASEASAPLCHLQADAAQSSTSIALTRVAVAANTEATGPIR